MIKVEEGHRCQVVANGGWDERITLVECGELVRSYLIKTRNFLLVYDTLLGPVSGAWLRQRALELAEDRPILVFNSHADWDHYFGNQAFVEPILGSRECRRRVLEVAGAGELARKRQDCLDSYGPVQLVAPTVVLDGEPTLDGGDLTIQALFTPGHRPDHLALWVPELRTLFPGDCLERPIPLVDEDSTPTSGTLEHLIASLTRMRALEPAWVLANHAPPCHGCGLLDDNLGYLTGVLQAARGSASLDELSRSCPAPEGCQGYYLDEHRRTLEVAFSQTR